MTESGYREGLSLGHEYAHADRHEWGSFASGEAELRAEALEAREDSPAWRAFKLGIVRAYRDATRTLRNGRWGT